LGFLPLVLANWCYFVVRSNVSITLLLVHLLIFKNLFVSLGKILVFRKIPLLHAFFDCQSHLSHSICPISHIYLAISWTLTWFFSLALQEQWSFDSLGTSPMEPTNYHIWFLNFLHKNCGHWSKESFFSQIVRSCNI
jgi:hypothetical protein